MGQGGRFRQDSLPLAQKRLKELLGLLASHYYHNKDMVSGAILAMALRHLSPTYEIERGAPLGETTRLQLELDRLFGMTPPTYVFQACDSLLKIVKDELARHGIVDPPSVTDAAD